MVQGLTLEQVIEFLMDAPLFGDLSETELSHLVHAMQIREFEAGEWIFREGEPGEAWYVICMGEVEVIKQSTTGERVIALLSRRACFGEMAILDGSPRSASVRTVSKTLAFRFPRSNFGRLLDDGNLAAYKLVHQMALVLVSRQRRTTSHLVELMSRGTDEQLRGLLAPLVDQSSVAE
jgi:CRP/FNR family cyclic AMP-dependent transcriptional regulator